MKKAISNPAELTETVIDNPENGGGARKNPKKVAAGYKGYIQRLKNENSKLKKKLSNKTSNEDNNMDARENAEEVYETGKNMVTQSILVIGGTFFAGKIIGFLTDRWGEDMGDNMRAVVASGVPIVSGAALATYGKGSTIAENAATGMVLSGVSTGVDEMINKVLPQGNEDLDDAFGYNYENGLADAQMSEGAIIVEPSGDMYMKDGTYMGNLKDSLQNGAQEDLSSQSSAKSLPDRDGGSEVQTGFNSFESGESYEV